MCVCVFLSLSLWFWCFRAYRNVVILQCTSHISVSVYIFLHQLFPTMMVERGWHINRGSIVGLVNMHRINEIARFPYTHRRSNLLQTSRLTHWLDCSLCWWCVWDVCLCWLPLLRFVGQQQLMASQREDSIQWCGCCVVLCASRSRRTHMHDTLAAVR